MTSHTLSARFGRAATWLGWFALAVLVLGPLYWILAASFKGSSEIIRSAPTWFPKDLTLENYQELFSDTPYPTYLRNSIVVAVATAGCVATVATLAGYAMYRLRIPGATWLSRTILLSYLAPGTLLLVPIYSLLASLRLLDSIAGLVVVNVAFASPFCVWLLRGFFDEIPLELDEAAMLDGAGPITILWRVIIPLLLPGLATIVLYSFVFSWTEFAFASQLVVTDELKTLPVGLQAIIGSYNVNWGLLMAGASVTTLPAVVLFALVGRFFVRGLASGAVTR